MVKRRCSCLSVDIKLKALDEVDKKNESKAEIAKRYGVPASTLSTWIKNSQSLRRSQGVVNLSFKRRRMTKFAEIDSALAAWCKQTDIPLSAAIVRAKALDIADNMGVVGFHCTDGWMARFKRRNRIWFSRRSAVHEDEVNQAIEQGEDLMPPQAPTESLDLGPANNLIPKQEGDTDENNQHNIVSASMPVFSVFRDVREDDNSSEADRNSHSNVESVTEEVIAIKQEPEDPDTLSWEETNKIRVQLGLKPLSVEKVTPMKPRAMPINAKSRNANLLQATLHLIKELDTESLEIISDAIRNRLESL